VIDLHKISKELSLVKIEGIAVESANETSLLLHLAADNDNGESTLYKLQLSGINK